MKKEETKEEKCIKKAKELIDKNPIWNCLLEKDKKILKKALTNAKRNSKTSVFPDFVFDGGFIEHFEVTASKENRKGSKLKRSEAEFERNKKSPEELIRTTVPRFQSPFVSTYEQEMESPELSYENYKESFQKNWEKHIESYDKYSGEKEIGIFLIEFHDTGIITGENNIRPYSLFLDRELLYYIFKFRDKISFVIFFHQDKIDTLCVLDIPEIICNIPKDIKWRTGTFNKKNLVVEINMNNFIN